MTRHLTSCPDRNEAIARSEKATKSPKPVLHLVVEGRYQPMYWLHVETRADSEFDALDSYLRDIWLECCGHLSQFTFPHEEGPRGSAMANPWEMFEDMRSGRMPGEEAMDDPIGKRVHKGDVFYYEYDFGSTTHLKLKVAGQRQGNLKKHEVRLLARNEPPEILCDCGKRATELCMECSYEPDGWLCESCAAEHPCGEEAIIPIANSPRVGVCGYTGL
jgi:hypothetical protein